MSKIKKRDTISQRVVEYLRKELNLTLEEIASLAGVEKGVLFNIAEGKSRFTGRQLFIIQMGTGKKMSELILH